MSFPDYKTSQWLEADDVPFYALIMAAMRRADTDNMEKLKNAFPETWTELNARYNLPGGCFPNEVSEYSDGVVWSDQTKKGT